MDAGARTGAGHLVRCLRIAKSASEAGIDCCFTVLGDSSAVGQVRAAGFEARQCSSDLNAEIGQLPFMVNRSDIVVFDFIHPSALADLNAIARRIGAWTSNCSAAVLIDGGASQSMRQQYRHMNTLRLDLLIAPYAGESISDNLPYPELVGPAYFPLPSAYAGVQRRATVTNAKRVLVTCGGADPYSATRLILDALESIENALEIRVIQGPMFGESLKLSIRDHAGRTRHSIEIEVDPPDLSLHMTWSDLAIATSGLTKYELAATGTPTLLIAIDAAHDEADQPFLKEGSARSLGVLGRVTHETIATSARTLLENPSERQCMAERGQRLVDGHGLERILRALLAHAGR